jgi:WD40 repeat protein
VGGGSGEVRVYDKETGAQVASFKGFEGGIDSVVFSPSGGQLAAAGFDGKVRIYDLKSGQLTRDFVPVPIEKREVSMVK